MLEQEHIADVAGNWWASAWQGQQGIGSSGDGMIDAFGIMARSRLHTPTDSAMRIHKAVATHVLKNLRQHGRAQLSTDYAPDWPLSGLLDTVGVGSGRLPIKTLMWIDNDGITVSVGYHGYTKRILGEREWEVRLWLFVPLDSSVMVVYSGTDEQEARRLYDIAAIALKDSVGRMATGADTAYVTLQCDTNEVACEKWTLASAA